MEYERRFPSESHEPASDRWAAAKEGPAPAESERLHPFTVLFAAIRIGRSFILPAIGGGLAAAAAAPGRVLVWALVFLSVPAFAMAVARYLSFRFRVLGEELILDSGVLVRRRRVIPLTRVQNIDFRQSALQRLCGVAELRVETAGGETTEAVLDVLAAARAESFRAELLERRRRALATEARSPEEEAAEEAPARALARLSSGDLVLAGATANEAGVIAAVLAAGLQGLYQLPLDLPDPEVWIEPLLLRIAPADIVVVALGFVILFVVVGWIFSILGSVVGYHDFTLERQGDELRKRYGLLTRRQGNIPLPRVQAVRVEESLLRRPLQLATLKIATAGGGPGDRPGRGAETFSPLARAPEVGSLISSVFGDFDYDGLVFQSVHPRARRRAFVRYSAVLLAAVVALLVFTRGVAWDPAWLALAALPPIAYLAAHLHYVHLGYALAPGYVVARAGFWNRITWIVPDPKVQTVHLVETPLQRRHGLASLVVDTAARGGFREARVVDLGRARGLELLQEVAVRAARAGTAAAAVLLLAVLGGAVGPSPLSAQTDFYNLDKDRPLRVEDAYATKRWAFELQVSPLALSQDRDGLLRYGPSLELKHGLLPGVDVSAGTHAAFERLGEETSSRFESLELSTLANLWVESRTLPAVGLRFTGHVPLESDGAGWVELRGLATRGLTGPWRGHLNGAVMAGDGRPGDWWAGVALDYVLPFRHTLLLAETWLGNGRTLDGEGGEGSVHSTLGLRRQLSPTLAMDAGIGRGWRGDLRRDWELTLGFTYEFAVRGLMPSGRGADERSGENASSRATAPDGAHGPAGAHEPNEAHGPNGAHSAADLRDRRGTPTLERVYHPMYLPAGHNRVFRRSYPALSRLFNAFDYGHGILYETLWARPDAPAALLEEEIYDHLTREVLPDPPRLAMPEASFMPRYARLAPLAKEMFEWAHILHRQSYDILADPRLGPEEREEAMEELLDHYLRSGLAFTSVPKGMEIMDEQYFSKEFRQRYPKFNGLIWAYHWLQVAAYEPLLMYDDPDRRQAAMNALLVRFWQMLEDPPARLPSEMPMTPAIAPTFTERYPRFAAVFDNLHMMHDVISDILVSAEVARGDKRGEIYRQADQFRDPRVAAISDEEWIAMARAHGVDAQGGPAVDWLPEAARQDGPPRGHEHAEPDRDAGHPERHDHRQEAHPEPDQPQPEAPPGHQRNEAEARATVAAFHEALAAADSVAALALLHPDVLIYEQGHAETLEEYRAGHLAADMEFAAGVARGVVREEIVVRNGTAIYLAETEARGTFRGREIEAAGLESMVLVRTPDGWRIRHIHWSGR